MSFIREYIAYQETRQRLINIRVSMIRNEEISPEDHEFHDYIFTHNTGFYHSVCPDVFAETCLLAEYIRKVEYEKKQAYRRKIDLSYATR